MSVHIDASVSADQNLENKTAVSKNMCIYDFET